MVNLEIVYGSQDNWQCQIVNRDESLPAVGDFLSSDNLTAKVWAGQDQTTIFTPTVIWASSGTGYATGLVMLSVSTAQCILLTPTEAYQVQIFVTRSGGDPVCVWWGTLTVLPSAGVATSLTSTYATFKDLQFYGPWLDEVQDVLTDVAGFYNYLLRARQWLDRIICNAARPLAYIYNIFTPLTPWGPVEAPNYIIQGYLQANYLLIRDVTIELVARRALHEIADKMVTGNPNDPWPMRSKYQRKYANNLLASYRCEMSISSAPSVRVTDTQGGGAQALATINPIAGTVTSVTSIILGVNYAAPVVALSGGTGTGATAVANLSSGEIPTYTVTNPGAGYYQKQTPDIAFNLGMISMR